jgi:hypothetical protein
MAVTSTCSSMPVRAVQRRGSARGPGKRSSLRPDSALLSVAVGAVSPSLPLVCRPPAGGLEGVERVSAPSTARTRRSGTPACFASSGTVASLASWLLLPAAGRRPGVAQRRLGPNSSATTATVDRALPSSAVQLRLTGRRPPNHGRRLPIRSVAVRGWFRRSLSSRRLARSRAGQAAPAGARPRGAGAGSPG